MEHKQTIEYIRKHLAAGHTEASLRQHFLNHGWSPKTLDTVFKQYHRGVKKRKGLTARPTSRQAQRRRKRAIWSGVVVLLLLLGALFVHNFLASRADKTPHVTVVHLSYGAEQGFDVHTVAGAIVQYTTANNGTLPTQTSPGSDGSSVVLCGVICDPATSTVSTLTVYKAAGITFHPYVPNLRAPDIATMYIVPGAKCSNTETIGDLDTVHAKAVVILYAAKNGASLRQHCVAL